MNANVKPRRGREVSRHARPEWIDAKGSFRMPSAVIARQAIPGGQWEIRWDETAIVVTGDTFLDAWDKLGERLAFDLANPEGIYGTRHVGWREGQVWP